MAEKLERKVMEIYGENAATRDIIAYGSDISGNIVETKDPDVIQTEAYKTGVRAAVVGNNSTTLQNRQALDFLFSRQLKYLYQHGIAEWGADETYYKSSVVKGSDGNLYGSITDNNEGHDPVTDTSHTYWRNFPTYQELDAKVNKAGDTMTGTLKMSGNNEVRFGTDDNYYFIKKINDGTFTIYNKNGKGLFLQKEEAHEPYYWNGTQAYRLLTTADLENIDYVVEYKNPNADDPNWYRKWKSGKLEQGGIVPATTENITFLKPFANTNYTVIGNISLTYRRKKEGDNSGSVLFFPEATSFCYVTWAARNFGDIDQQNISWRADGQGAQ